MKWQLILFLFIGVLGSQLYPKNLPAALPTSEIDSLVICLNSANDSNKLELYYQLSSLTYQSDAKQAIYYDSLGLKLARKLENIRQEGIFLNNLGIDFYRLSDFNNSHFYFNNAKTAFLDINDSIYLLKVLNNLGAVYKILGFYKLSADNFAEAINLKRVYGDTLSLITTLNNIAVLYDKVGLFNEGISCLEEALFHAKILNNNELTYTCYQNLGLIQLSLQDYETSIKSSEKALKLLPKDNYNESCTIFNNLALCYQHLGEYELAEQCYQKSLHLFSKGINEHVKANTLQFYATYLYNINHYAQALTYATEALSLAEKNNFNEIQLTLYQLLAKIHKHQNNLQKAYKYLSAYNQLSDSTYNKSLSTSLMLMNINERVVQAKHEQLILQNKNQLQAQQIIYSNKLINIMLVFSLVLILLLGIIIYAVITKRKNNKQLIQLNKQLSESEGKYKAVVEQSPEIMLIHQNGKILFANQNFYQVSGYSADDLATLSVFDLVHPDEKEKIIKMAGERIEGIIKHEHYEVRGFGKNGKPLFLDMSFSRIMYYEQAAILGIGIDITPRKKNLEIIKKLTAAIDQSPIMILITNKKGEIEYVNPAFEEATGYKSEEVLNQNPRILSSGQESHHIFKDLWNDILKGKIWRGELLNKRKNGELFWESLVISPILDENNMITHFVANMEDITQKRSTDEALSQREEALRHANITKDKFFSIIAHDLKNPFNAIIGFTSLLTDEYDNLDDEERKSFLENISLASNTTYRLLENLLEWSRTQTGKIKFNPHNIDLNSIVNEVISLQLSQATKKGIKLISEIPFNTMVFADQNMIRTVIRNLFSNAVKFTSSGEIRITAKKKKEIIQVCVSDTGIGIPEEGIDKLFKLDEQYLSEGTEFEKGTGIGLILSKEFIIKHQGEIWVKSKKNMGSKFYFTLPIYESTLKNTEDEINEYT